MLFKGDVHDVIVGNASVHRGEKKRKAIPVEAWTGPEGFKSSRRPELKTRDT